VFRRTLLSALARAVEQGSAVAIAPALSGTDPIVRTVVKRRLRQLLARARLSTGVDDEIHVLRLAYLLAWGTPEAGYDDVDAIRAEQEAAARTLRAPVRGPWLTLGIVVFVLLAVTVPFGVRRALRPFDPRQTPDGRVLGEELTSYVIAVSRGPGRAGEVAAARGRATSKEARRALGGDVCDKLGALLDATAKVPAAGAGMHEAVDAFTAATATFDRALAERNLPFFVDSDVMQTAAGVTPLLISFYVERDVRVESEGKEERVVYLWRLDSLNLRQGYLGYTKSTTPAALVLLDQIESDLVQYVLPALPEGEPMSFVDLETELSGEAWVAPLEQRAGELLRRHYSRVPEARTPAAQRVGELLARRRTLVAAWRKDLAGLGHILRVPERLIPEANYSEGLELRISRKELSEWDDLHDELLSHDVLAAFLAYRTAYARSVERHEVQHRLDYARGLIPVPELLCKMTGLENPLDAPASSLPGRARDELSAYLASIITAEHTPLLELLLLSRHLFDKPSLGGVYWYTALAAFRGIASELGIDPESLLGRGAVRRERSAALVGAVLDKPPEQIRAAATRFYQKAYGQKLAVVQAKSARENRPWRH
jgi:hypothetical protein